MENVPYNKIKEKLAAKRKQNKELAAYMGVTDATISRWCTNETQPSIKDLYRIARFLGVKVFELLVDDAEIPDSEFNDPDPA